MNEAEYYSIIKLKNINLENISAHIKKFETLDFAYNFLNTDIVIVKEKQDAQRANSGFIYPIVYSYKFYDRNRQPYFLGYKNNKVSEYILETRRSLYSHDKGGSSVLVIDRNEKVNEAPIGASSNIDASFVLNLFEFLINFEYKYSSDWEMYNLKNVIEEEKEKFEKEISDLENDISDLNEKLNVEKIKNKNLRIKIKQYSTVEKSGKQEL